MIVVLSLVWNLKLRNPNLVFGLGCRHKLRSTRGSAIDKKGKQVALSKIISPPPSPRWDSLIHWWNWFVTWTFSNMIAKMSKNWTIDHQHEKICLKGSRCKWEYIISQTILTVNSKLWHIFFQLIDGHKYQTRYCSKPSVFSQINGYLIHFNQFQSTLNFQLGFKNQIWEINCNLR